MGFATGILLAHRTLTHLFAANALIFSTILAPKRSGAALGDDWVALNILAPMALMAPGEVVTHTIGGVRSQLLDGVVDWDELLHFLRMADGPAPKRADALHLTYGVCIDALGLDDEVVDKVWAHVVRFIDSIDLPSPRRARRGSLRPLQSPDHGLGWTFSKDIIGECTASLCRRLR